MSRIPKDAFDNQQDDPDVQDRSSDQGSQQVQQDEIDEALRNRKVYPDVPTPS